jgi:hypothetical protein
VSAKSLLQDLLSELAELHETAAEILSDDIIRNEIVRDLGGTPGTPAPQFPPAGLQSVKAYRDASEPGLEALLEALQDFRRFHESLRAFGEALNLGGDAAAEEGYRVLMDVLGWNLIRLRYPFLYFILQTFSFVEDTVSPFEGQYGKVPLPAAFNRLAGSVVDGIGYLKRSHFNSEEGVKRFSDVVALSSFAGVKLTRLKKITGDVIYGFDQVPGLQLGDPPTPAADRTQARMLSLNFPRCIGSGLQDLVASMGWVPQTQGGRGLFLSLGGGLQVAQQLSTKWRFNAELHCAGAVSVIIGGDRKLQFHGPDEGSDFRGVVSYEARPDPTSATGQAFNLAIATNTGLSAELVHLEGSLTQKAAQLRLTMLGAVATLSPDSFDNFIAKILPKDGLRVNFDLGVGVASDRGAFYEGTIRSAGTGGTPRPTTPPPPGVQPPPLPPLPPETGPGFGLTIPIGKSLGPLTIHNLQLRFGTEDVDGKSSYLLQAASSISTKLGPVMARVDRAGLKFGVRFPDQDAGETGNLGIADVDVGAVLPNGVSLAIDVKGYVTGGGFLFHGQGAHHRQGVRSDRHQDARWQQGLLTHRLHHRRRLPAYSDRHGVHAARDRRHGCNQPHVRRRSDARGPAQQDARYVAVSAGPGSQRARDHSQPHHDVPGRGGCLSCRPVDEDHVVPADARPSRHRDHGRGRQAAARDRARHDQRAAADQGKRPGAAPHGRAGTAQPGPDVGRRRRGARRLAARAEVRAHRRDGAAREHAAGASQFRDGRRRLQSALRAPGELSDAQAHHDRTGVG